MGFYKFSMQCLKLRVWKCLRISNTIQIIIACILLHTCTCIVWTDHPVLLRYTAMEDAEDIRYGVTVTMNSSKSEMKQSLGGGGHFQRKRNEYLTFFLHLEFSFLVSVVNTAKLREESVLWFCENICFINSA